MSLTETITSGHFESLVDRMRPEAELQLGDTKIYLKNIHACQNFLATRHQYSTHGGESKA